MNWYFETVYVPGLLTHLVAFALLGLAGVVLFLALRGDEVSGL